MTRANPETIRAALAYVPAHDRDLWVRMGMAVKAELGDAGFDLWDAWSQSAENYEAKAAKAVWKSIREGGATSIGSLLFEAKQRGYRVNGETAHIDPVEIERYKRERAEASAREEAERTARQERAAAWAAEIWKRASPAAADHRYLSGKGVAPTPTMRQMSQEDVMAILGYEPKADEEPLRGRLLVLPVKVGERITTLELIDEDGRKSALYGGAKAGGYWAAQPLPEDVDALCIGEGAATMLSVARATGLCVVAALSAGNLMSVANAMRSKFPKARLIVCGDLGAEGKARTAAQEGSALLALPDFGSHRAPEQDDFNDLALTNGWEAVKRCVDVAKPCTFAPLPPTVNAVSGLVLRCVADVTPRPVRWLWQGRIARGKVTMLAGHPGLGKSQLCASIAAIVTTGGLWPVDRTRCEQGSVLIFSAEDDVEDTIRPRLEAAGADLSRVHVLETVAVTGHDGTLIKRAFSLVDDMPRLAAKLAELGDVALLVIDPISAFLGDTDSHQNAAVRAVLAPLAEVAAKHGAAVIAVSHLRKSAAGEAMHNITGSLAFVAASRAAYIVAKDQADPLRRLLLPAKNNLGDDQTGYAFRIAPQSLDGGIETSRVEWEAERVTVTADEALAPLNDREELSALDDASDFLKGLLADCPLPAKRVLSEARDAGHAEKTIRRAAKAIGVEMRKEGGHFGDGKQRWVWALKMAKTTEDGQGETLGTFSKVGHLQAHEPPVKASEPDMESF